MNMAQREARALGVSLNFVSAARGLTYRHVETELWRLSEVLDGFIARGMELGMIETRQGFEDGEIDKNWLVHRAMQREMRASKKKRA
jgi:hypothetical protein